MPAETKPIRSVAVVATQTNHYVSFDCDLAYAKENQLDLINDDRIWFAGPYTLIAEVDVYLPQDDDFTTEPLDAEMDIIVYDAYGPHGIRHIGDGYESTGEVREWIDETLEAEAPGEYAIGYVFNEA